MQSLAIFNDEVNQDGHRFMYHERFVISSTTLNQSRVIYGFWLVLANVGGMQVAIGALLAFFIGYYSEFNF
jgi:hypothetical protein